MRRERFLFSLPPERIVQRPSRRGQARLLVLSRGMPQPVRHERFADLPAFLSPGDVMVLNNSRVIPTRLWGTLANGAQREITLIAHEKGPVWRVMVRPQGGVKKGSILSLGDDMVRLTVRARAGKDLWYARTNRDHRTFVRYLFHRGDLNVPFYLRYGVSDRQRYQTIYASVDGSCQPPTAGLHYTHALLRQLKRRGVSIVYLTLHVSGSILPVSDAQVGAIRIPREWYRLPVATASAINRARERGGRVVAVGTTVMRAVESAADPTGRVSPGRGWTGLSILPGYRFRTVNAFLTNFHMPASSHLLLTCAFGGYAPVMGAYRAALRRKYGFLDFGDAMLIR